MSLFKTGAKNLITDVAGLKVGNIENLELLSGVTAVICDEPTTAAVQVMGGAPGTRETDLLSPENVVDTVNALVLSGGSAFGLDAATGVQAHLREKGQGFEVGGQHIPIVPAAILFDLLNGGDKDWGTYAPYREMGFAAAKAASDKPFQLGTIGAGAGALTADFQGGLGSASTVLANGVTIGAIVAVNALGSVTIGNGPHFWAAPFEIGDEFGGLGFPSKLPPDAQELRIKFRDKRTTASTNTTIGIIATDAVLTCAQSKRLAVAAHDGFARAFWPSHTPLDGDLIFSLATGQSGVNPTIDEQIDLSAIAASTMARAIARGVFEAASTSPIVPSWSSVHTA